VHDKVMEKLMVLHPPQAPVPNDMERFAAPETVRFVFIGNAFFSKGGLAMFRAFERVRARFPNISLTVISAMVMGYNVTKAGARELREAASFLQRNSVWVTYYGNLPNEQVLTLLPEHHVGLLPSFAETYGYAVLEMQAAGVPVITTDIRAFPEINPDEAGWRISLPKSELRGNSPREDIVRYGVIVQQGLEKILTGIMENPAALKEKSLAAQARIRACHCPEAYGRALLAAYEGKNLA
jgi:glycosyltransferase involved in cell wall biosynthesis